MIKFKRFEQFLNEAAKTGERLKLVVITEHKKSDEEDTPDFLVNRATKAGMETYMLSLDGAIIEDNGDGSLLVKNRDDDKGFVINNENTVIISRRGVVKNTYTRGIQSLLENHGFFCINPLTAIEICENKYITAERLLHAGLPTPKTALIPDEGSIDGAVEEIGGKFPVILKTLSGAGGVGVSIIESKESLKSVLQTIWKVSKSEVLIQEKIESDHDIRIQVLTKKFNYHRDDEDNVKIIGYMRRNRVDGDFRTNHSLGGTVEKTDLTEEHKELAIQAAAAMGCHWCGVDLITDKKTGKAYVLEVNASPGTKGIKKAIGETILGDIIDFIKNKDNWSKQALEIGFREVVDVDGIGSFVAKFDSGNGAKSSSMHADHMEEKDGKVHWEIGGKKYSAPVIGYSHAEVGDDVHKRPIIEIDITFNGMKYPNMHFSLVDRTEKSTPMLINRKMMEKMGLVVNPQKTFVQTYFDGEYSVEKANGEKHHGIILKKK